MATEDHGVPFRDAARVWARVALLSFGGPAGQIAVMHRILVEEKKWIGETRFLHALNYCMLLPGPEAHQLAIYIGWLLHRTRGGILAGTLFVLPGLISLGLLSWLYAVYANIGGVQGLFFGLKAAVLAVVLEAVMRVGRRALKSWAMVWIAALAFVALFLFAVPFPVVIATAALIGFVGHAARLRSFEQSKSKTPASELNERAAAIDTAFGRRTPGHLRPSLLRLIKVALIGLSVWLGPVLILVATLGAHNVFSTIGLFNSRMAIVTFGGAYSVLAYMAQQAVEHYHWLKPSEMLVGLGFAETTPGPLISVVQFVAYMAALSVKDAIMAAHGAQHYDAKSLTEYLNLINKASLMIPGSTHEIVRGLAYSQGIAKTALGSSDEQNILMIAFLNRMGLPGTRGGTNLSAAMTRSIPGVFGSGLLKGESYESLAAQGMIDAQGHAKVFTDGKFDTMKWMGLLSDYVAREFASHPEAVARQDIMKNFQRSYGSIGDRAVSVLSSPQAIEQMRTMAAQMQQFGGFEGMQQIFKDESVAQQYQNAMTNLQSAMVELGLTLLPTVTKALQRFNSYMGELIDWMTKNPGQVKQYAKDVAYFAAALIGLGAISVATSAVIGLTTVIGGLKNTAAKAYGVAGLGSAKGWLGGAGMATAAGAVGYGLGTLAYDNFIQGTSFDENSGRQIAQIMAFLGSQTAKDALAANRDYARPGVARGTIVHTQINLDGKKIAKVVTEHQGRMVGKPSTGINTFDGRMHLTPAGSGGF